MIETYYKYNIYMLYNGFEVDEYSSTIVEMVESDLNGLVLSSIGNPVIIEPIVRNYLLS